MKIDLPKYFTRQDARICGVYFLIRKDCIVYIGKSTDVVNRVFLTDNARTKKFDLVRIIPCCSDKLNYYEKRWIIRFRPKYNRTYLFTWKGPQYFKKDRVAINTELCRLEKNDKPHSLVLMKKAN